MNEEQRPAEPAEDDKEDTCAGFAGLARYLNDEYPGRKRPISRQLVHKWYLYRHHNGFPGPISKSGNGGRPVFDKEDVDKWYVGFRRSHGDPQIKQRTTTPASGSQAIRNDGGDSLAA